MRYFNIKDFTNQTESRKTSRDNVPISFLLEAIKRPETEHYDIFLSYSYSDKEIAKKFYDLLVIAGYNVYIDLKDNSLDRNNVDRTTAKRITNIMNKCDSLIFLHTNGTTLSKWCPWELGYMTSKTNFRCAIVPVTKEDNCYQKQEYLKLYPEVKIDKIDSRIRMYVYDEYKNKLFTLKDFIKGVI